jgi:hypothetical protein
LLADKGVVHLAAAAADVVAAAVAGWTGSCLSIADTRLRSSASAVVRDSGAAAQYVADDVENDAIDYSCQSQNPRQCTQTVGSHPMRRKMSGLGLSFPAGLADSDAAGAAADGGWEKRKKSGDVPGTWRSK